MARQKHVFVPKFNNSYAVAFGDEQAIIRATHIREAAGTACDGQLRLISCGGRSASYDTPYGIMKVTRLGRGERINTSA